MNNLSRFVSIVAFSDILFDRQETEATHHAVEEDRKMYLQVKITY